MKTIKLLGTAVYQADLKPKGARNFRRGDVQTLVQYEIPSITAADLTFDAVVVMPGDVRRIDRLKDAPRRRSFAGWNGALWRPLRLGGANATVDTFGPSLLHFPGRSHRSEEDPILETANSPASVRPVDRMDPDEIFFDDRFSGAVAWTNKAERLAAQLEAAARLLVVVDGAVWKRNPGPAWVVEHVDGPAEARGLVMLDEDRASWGGKQDLFRPDRLDQAVGLSVKRFGQAEALGSIERMDTSFVEYDDVTAACRTHLADFLQKGESLLPHLAGTAIRAFVELHASFRGETPLSPFQTVDLDFVMDRIAILDEALADRSLPGRMLENAAGFRTGFRAIEDRIAAERSARARQALAEVEDDALATLGAVR